MKIAFGSDHAGFELKNKLMNWAKKTGYEYKDFGAFNEESSDYPLIAEVVCKAVVTKEFNYGVLVCGTGIGMSIAANKIKGIRAALVYDENIATRAKTHNDANVLCFGALITTSEKAVICLNNFSKAEFESGRHKRRIEEIDRIEEKIN